MGRLVTESGMLQEASTEEAKAWNASARRIWMVKPTCSTQYSTVQYSEAHLLVRHVQVHVHSRVVHCVVGDLKNT